MAEIVLGLGSNLGDRGRNLQQALTDLEKWGVRILRSSSIYESEPVGFKDQPWFYNIVVMAETNLSPADLLKAISAIELSLKRERTVRMGPRTLDIDILFYDHLVVDEHGLQIPHPRLSGRNFVLVPLNEVSPDFVHPVLKKSVKQLLKECSDTAIVTTLN